MTQIGECKLCGNKKKLLKSHILPKFVSRWLKRTSYTGFLRRPVEPNLRIQDFDKEFLLCSSCENMFSKWEKRFAENIFMPFHENNQQSFKYGPWLLRFIVSLSWRVAVTEIESFYTDNPEWAPFLDRAIKQWSSFLINEGVEENTAPYEHHLFLFDLLEHTPNDEIPKSFHWYIFRGVDGTTIFSEEEIRIYTKFPGIAFCSGVHPPELKGWKNTRIHNEGVLEPPQQIDRGEFGEFLMDRVKLVEDLRSRISTKQQERINKTEQEARRKGIKAIHPDRAYNADLYLRRKKRDDTATKLLVK